MTKRESIKRFMEDYYYHTTENDDVVCLKITRDGLRDLINALSGPEREKTEWRRVWNELDGHTDYICRNCNDKNAHPTNYCPSCGADMRGKHEIYYISRW